MSDDRIERYFATPGPWQAELGALRAILRAGPLVEEFKWRSPCYTWRGANVATIWSFKASCGLSFFKGVLLRDPSGILEAPGENSRSVRLARFTDLAGIAARQAMLADYVREAIANEEAGLKVAFPKDDLDHPEELTEALGADPELEAAFHALTPGRQRGYVLHFAQPVNSATRAARIDRQAERIKAGKGLQDR